MVEDAQRQLEQLGLSVGNTWPEVSHRPAGTILDQNPPPGTELPAGSAIDFVYSTGGAQRGQAPPTEEPEEVPAVEWADTPASADRMRQADVRITIPPGPRQEVVILVIDDDGIRQAYRKEHQGNDSFTVRIEGRGKEVKIQVYIGGEMFKEAVI